MVAQFDSLPMERIIAISAPASPKIAPEAPTVGVRGHHRQQRPRHAGRHVKEQEWPAAECVLAGHPQNEEHDQVPDQMLGVRVHEAAGDQPPELAR